MKESKKEALTKFHRGNIIDASQKLFLVKGIENISMDDIAKEAGYSKATLYVYFKNKDEIISCMTLHAMKMLLVQVKACIGKKKDFKSQFFSVCYATYDFQKEHLFYYKSIFTEINVDLELEQTPKIYHEIYEVGEAINKEILSMFKGGVAEGAIRSDIKLPQAAFTLWGSIFGVIHISKEKNKYFEKCFNLSEQEFLQYSFELLYQSIKM